MSFDKRTVTGEWDYGQLPGNVRFGEQCWFESRHSFARFRSQRDAGLTIGDRVRIYTWSVFNVEPEGSVDIGSDTILVGAVLMCAQRIVIGNRVIISHHVTIADSDFHPLDPRLREQDAIALRPQHGDDERPHIDSSPVRIGDDVTVGIGAILLKGIRIGAGAHVAAGAVVTDDVPPGGHVAGNPARLVGDS